MQLVAIDPGLRVMGWAVFNHHGALHAARLLRNPDNTGRGPATWARMAAQIPDDGTDLAIEYPQIYRGGKADPSDLIELAGVVGACTVARDWAGIRGFLPRAWKGQIPKDVHQKRILATLTPAEIEIVRALDCPASLAHNVLDAIGIGLHALGRQLHTGARVMPL
jgi:hypothetical protein